MFGSKTRIGLIYCELISRKIDGIIIAWACLVRVRPRVRTVTIRRTKNNVTLATLVRGRLKAANTSVRLANARGWLPVEHHSRSWLHRLSILIWGCRACGPHNICSSNLNIYMHTFYSNTFNHCLIALISSRLLWNS